MAGYPPYQLVTLVVDGGTPVQLVDQTGAPFPTTGTGALVFANGATLYNTTLLGTTTLSFENLIVTGDLTVGGSITSGVWNGSVIGIEYGGTNSTATPTAGGVAYGTGTAYAFTAAGTAGYYLQSTGASAPVWSSVPSYVGQTGFYGSFYDAGADQTAASTTAAYLITIGSTFTSNGVTISSGTRITFANSGTYLFEPSIQFINTDSQDQDVDLWYRLNGSNIANSNSRFSIPAKHGGTNGHAIITSPLVLGITAGQYVELMWSTTSTSVYIHTYPAAASPTRPVIPGVIVGVTSQPQIGLGYAGLTSTTSTLIGTGSKTFTVNLPNTSDAYVVGSRIRVAYPTAPSNFMEGVITAYSGTTLTVNVDSIGGSGTYASWNFSIAGTNNITINNTPISSGVTGRVLYDNGGFVGELVTGTPGKTITSKSATPTIATWDYLQSTSDDNVIIGTNAMLAPTAGTARWNIAIGTEALRDITTTDTTVAIGYHAAATMATGRSGTYVGHVAGEFVTTGSSNTFIGGFAGRGNATNPITGFDNTMVGEAAGLNLEGAGPNYNTGVGFNALFGLRDGDSNTAMGTASGLSLVHTSGNTMYGIGSYRWGDGTNNVVVGYNAANGLSQIVNTAGGTTPLGGTTLYFSDTSMMFVGCVLYSGGYLKVGSVITSITPNVSVVIDTPTFNAVPLGTAIYVLGSLIQTSTTAGGTTLLGGTTLYFTNTANMAVGMVLVAPGVLASNTRITGIVTNTSVTISVGTVAAVPLGTSVKVFTTQHTGARNTYVGYYSGYSAQNAIDDVTAVGYGSLRYTTSGARNTALGSYTLGSTSSLIMNDCTAVGYRAGWYVTADDNTAVGAGAMRSVSGNPLTGTNNTAVGSDALADLQGAATGNTAVGNAVALNITTGSNNTFLGTNIAVSLTTGSNNIIIGPSINVAAAGTSNYLNIGNAIYGTGILGGTVQIGINKTVPTATLHVGGTTVFDNTITYGGVTLANSVTGTGSMVLSAAPTLTGNVRINGNLGINISPLSYAAVYNAINATGATAAYGFRSDTAVQSDVTNTYYGFSSNPSTQAAAFTLTTLRHFQAFNATIGATSAVTNQFGFYSANLTGATNNYGFYGAVTQATGAYNLYMGGSAFNYMAGNLAIADTPTTYYGFRVGSTLTGATSAIAAYIAPTIQSDITTSAVIVRSTPATQAAAFTLAGLTHYSATSTSIGAGSAITNQYGFRAESNLNGATNNYGFFTNLASASGVWAFYGSGTAASLFGGAVTISGVLTYGGVALANSVTGTGSMVLSASPALTGTPTAPTQAINDNSTKIATTAYVDRVITQQMVSSASTAVATGTTLIPWDNTIPQSTEGDQYMSVTITPKTATSKLLISVSFNYAHSTADVITLALFRDSGANAVAATANWCSAVNIGQQMTLLYQVTSGSTAATTFKVRAGPNSTGTLTFNGVAGTGLFGGVSSSTIVVTELGS